MSAEWGSLPILSLRCVLDHLSIEDAVSALSTCRHWRSAILLYEGRKDFLKLNVKDLERNLFLTRLFKKYTRKLQIVIDSNKNDLEKFMNFVLPQFFETKCLQELIFIGPVYLQQKSIISAAKINRIITESLMFKNLHYLQRLVLLGCEMSPVKNEEYERIRHKHVEFYSRPLSYSNILPTDKIFSSINAPLMSYSSLRHLTFDFDLMSTSALRTISLMGEIKDLTLTVGQKRPVNIPLVDWSYANSNLRVTVIIITVPHCMMNMVIEELFIEGLPLFSLKVMFCETLHSGVLERIVMLYKETLQELVWVDSPGSNVDVCSRIIKHHEEPQLSMSNVNPIILLCWQCSKLKRLVLHGYWMWEYDLLGIVRLRRNLKDLEVSSVYNRQSRFASATRSDQVVRVLASDVQSALDRDYIRKINSYTAFPWSPVPWMKLHPALRPGATLAHRIAYVLRESLRPALRKF